MQSSQTEAVGRKAKAGDDTQKTDFLWKLRREEKWPREQKE